MATASHSNTFGETTRSWKKCLRAIGAFHWREIDLRQQQLLPFHRSALPKNSKVDCKWIKFRHPSREHIGNIDDWLKLSSETSMMHQFYIEHRKHWWIFDVTPMLHPCFRCFSTLKPTMIHLLNINHPSRFHRWIINQTIMNHRWRNSYVYVFYGWIQSNKITNSSYQIIISNHIEQK